MSPTPLPGKKKKARVVLPLPYWLREFALIRMAVVSFAGTLGIGMAAVFASNYYKTDAADYKAQTQQIRDTAYSRFAQVETEKREIRAYQPQFVALRSKGLVGEENRLDWIENIRQVQEQRRLLSLSYDIAPQQPVTLEQPLMQGDYQLRASRMSLHMELLHEMDLFNFLDDMKRRNYFAVQECSLRRQAGAANQPNSPNLAADCTLNWLTLQPAALADDARRKRSRR